MIGKDPGALVVVLRGRRRIAKQPADIRIVHNRRRPRRHEAVDAPSASSSEMVLPSGALSSARRRQLDGDLLRPPGMLDAAADPVHVRRLDAEIVFQDGARPDIRGELIFRQADLLALQVLRLA
jgi:hypothetical protein